MAGPGRRPPPRSWRSSPSGRRSARGSSRPRRCRASDRRRRSGRARAASGGWPGPGRPRPGGIRSRRSRARARRGWSRRFSSAPIVSPIRPLISASRALTSSLSWGLESSASTSPVATTVPSWATHPLDLAARDRADEDGADRRGFRPDGQVVLKGRADDGGDLHLAAVDHQRAGRGREPDQGRDRQHARHGRALPQRLAPERPRPPADAPVHAGGPGGWDGWERSRRRTWLQHTSGGAVKLNQRYLFGFFARERKLDAQPVRECSISGQTNKPAPTPFFPAQALRPDGAPAGVSPPWARRGLMHMAREASGRLV